MSTDRISGVVTMALAAVVLVAATALVQASQYSASRIVDGPVSQSATMNDARSAAGLDKLAAEQSTTDIVDYSAYPGGAGGDSNGHLSAAQKGEPVGATGTSGGSQPDSSERGR
jgi:hypothetical protein